MQASLHEKKTGWHQWALIFCADVHMELAPSPSTFVQLSVTTSVWMSEIDGPNHFIDFVCDWAPVIKLASKVLAFFCSEEVQRWKSDWEVISEEVQWLKSDWEVISEEVQWLKSDWEVISNGGCRSEQGRPVRALGDA